jgi:hypothetical protein
VSLFTRHPLVLQTAFSELKRRAQEQPFLLAGSPGSVGVRQVRGRPFYYRQYYDAEGKKTAEYIGAVGNEDVERRAAEVREAIGTTQELVQEGRLLAQAGYVRTDSRATAILGAIANGGLFRAGAILVGSHAYGAVLNEMGIRAAAFATEDVDLARARTLALGRDEEVDFASILAASTVRLVPVPALDRRGPVTSYKAPGRDRLRVDLLVPGSGSAVSTREVPELRAHAQAMPHLQPLLETPVDSLVLGRDGVVPVRVPRAEALAWHKALLAQMRSATSDKRGKDRAQAAVLLAVLAEDAPDALETALVELPRGIKGRTRSAASAIVDLLRSGGHERAAAIVGAMVR